MQSSMGHSLAYQGLAPAGGMIPLQNHQHDSRKAEAPWRAAVEKGDVNFLERTLLNLNLKAHVGLKCHCVPIKCSFKPPEALKK